MASETYKPVPVEEARHIAARYSKSMVVILSYDPAAALTHTTTYGVAPEDKEQAADVGEMCARLVCGEGFELRKKYEDYRFTDQGKRAEQIEALTVACKAAWGALRSLLAVREGLADSVMEDVANACERALALADNNPQPSTDP
ncbi:MAG: hypothetical protein KY476_00515 [Planctomycetes bacterium]|nr:hypothetical protein [Planctomycetota bacterium]